MTNKSLLIGTRDSVLATWQARYVANYLNQSGCQAELCFIKTEGDRVLDTPLPLMGGKGVFTKALDEALVAGEIDLAVHSLKDIPTLLPEGIVIGAVCKREDASDVLVTRKRAIELASIQFANSGDKVEHFSAGIAEKNSDRESNISDSRQQEFESETGFLRNPDYQAVIASSSNRRIGQWLARFPHHRMTDIRGNIQTRLRKLTESNWDGAVFASAGLKRLGLEHYTSVVLEWMLPAPGQGAMAVTVRKNDYETQKEIQALHDPDTALCTAIERDVLKKLEGGCSAPVGALAIIENGMVRLKVNAVYPDGKDMIHFEVKEKKEMASGLGKQAAEEALRRGADKLIRDLKNKD